MDVDGRRLCQRTRFGNEAAREPRPLRASAAPSRGGLSSRPTEAFEWLQVCFAFECLNCIFEGCLVHALRHPWGEPQPWA